MRTHKLSIVILISFLLVGQSGMALVKPSHHGKSAKSSKSAKLSGHASKKHLTKTTAKTKHGAHKKSQRRHTPYILAPKSTVEIESSTPDIISDDVITTLAAGNLEQAGRKLQLEESSDKVGYLLNQIYVAMGQSMSDGGKPSSFDRASAYHNLVLFLERHHQSNPKFVKEAIRYYSKAARENTHRNASNILLATLYADTGDLGHAEKYFSRVDITALSQRADGKPDYAGLEYLAAYYAARREVSQSISALQQAYDARPLLLLQWLHVGDDFWMIEDDPVFQKQVQNWREDYKANEVKAAAPRTKVKPSNAHSKKQKSKKTKTKKSTHKKKHR